MKPPRRIGPARLTDRPGPGTRFDPVVEVAHSLKADRTTCEILDVFGSAGIRSLLLKGPAIARWLYDNEGERPYRDSDLLVQTRLVEVAEDLLAEIGFEHAPLDDLPHDRPWHAHAWVRHSDNAGVDLHRSLIGIAVSPDEAWSVLSEETEQMDLLGSEVEVLAPAARTLHVALHAAQDGRRLSKPIEDLRRALSRVDFPIWEQAALLAARLDALSAFVAGLRLEPEGQKLLERLDVHTKVSMEDALRAEGAPQLALSLEWLTHAPGVKEKLLFLARRVVPPPTFMRAWSSMARRGRLGLLLAYLWRPVWSLLQIGPALRSWRRARKQVKTP